QTATERMLSDLWAAEFGRKDVGRDDDFFDLGGDSLIGARLAAQIHAATGVALNLEAIANHPTLAGLAQLIEQRGAEGESTPPLVRVVRDQPLPLSLWEERIWVLSRDREISARYTTAR